MNEPEHVVSILGPREVEGTYSVRCTCGWRHSWIRKREHAESVALYHYDAGKERHEHEVPERT